MPGTLRGVVYLWTFCIRSLGVASNYESFLTIVHTEARRLNGILCRVGLNVNS
jgi:hypothetical protein